ncbi:DUF3429 domain-containing protein [Jiella sp. M17.18]|uniref:DUF3429 domain-containing protein n=1 Tax=Jiella sp. M17.18 TaxID=3234247 RepID=UPI0034DE69A7
MSRTSDTRHIAVDEPAKTPPISIFFAYVAMLPLVLGALALWFAPDAQSFLAMNLTLFWGASILMFLSGVRRGVSFRTPAGPTLSQLAMMLWLYVLGFACLCATVWGFPLGATIAEIVGYASLAVLDPIAARREEAPLFFARLRPVQMAIPILSLIAVAVAIWQSPYL